MIQTNDITILALVNLAVEVAGFVTNKLIEHGMLDKPGTSEVTNQDAALVLTMKKLPALMVRPGAGLLYKHRTNLVP